MRTRALRLWLIRLLMTVLAGSAFQTGCAREVQKELALLFSPESNLNYVDDSRLVDWFGPGVLQFW